MTGHQAGSKAEMDALVQPEGNRSDRSTCKNCGAPEADRDGLCTSCQDSPDQRNHRSRQDARRLTSALSRRIQSDNPWLEPERAYALATKVVVAYPEIVVHADYNSLNYGIQEPGHRNFQGWPKGREQDKPEPEKPDWSPRDGENLPDDDDPKDDGDKGGDKPEPQESKQDAHDLSAYDHNPYQVSHPNAPTAPQPVPPQHGHGPVGNPIHPTPHGAPGMAERFLGDAAKAGEAIEAAAPEAAELAPLLLAKRVQR